MRDGAGVGLWERGGGGTLAVLEGGKLRSGWIV